MSHKPQLLRAREPLDEPLEATGVLGSSRLPDPAQPNGSTRPGEAGAAAIVVGADARGYIESETAIQRPVDTLDDVDGGAASL